MSNIKRRGIGLALLLAVLTALLSGSLAFADSEQTEDSVAGVTTAAGTEFYDSLSTALTAAQRAGTAKLTVLKDAACTEISIDDPKVDLTVEVVEGATLSLTGNYDNGISVYNGKLTLAGGAIVIPNYTGTAVRLYPMDNGATASLTISGADVSAPRGSVGVQVSTKNEKGSAQFLMTGGSITAAAGADYALQLVQYANVTISGGRISGGKYGLYSNGSVSTNVAISGGSFTGSTAAITIAPGSAQKLGQYLASGYAYRDVNSSSWIMNADVTSLTGTVTARQIPLQVTSPESTAISSDETAILSVTAVVGGEGGPSYQWYQDGEAIEGATAASYETVGLRAGTRYEFYCQVSYDGFVVTSGTAEIEVAPEGVTYGAYTNVGGKITYYETVSEAFHSVQYQDAAVYLLRDQIVLSEIEVTGGVISFHGGAHTLIYAGNASSANLFRVLGRDTKFTIADGLVSMNRANGRVLYIASGAEASLTGATLVSGAYSSYAVYNGGKFTMTGGAIQCEAATSYGIYSISKNAAVTITGGELSAAYSSCTPLYLTTGTAAISGGSFHGVDTALRYGGGTVRLTGGTFTGVNTITVSTGSAAALLEKGYAYQQHTDDGDRWLTTPEKLTTISGALSIQLIPVELKSYTDTVDMLMNNYDPGPTLSVEAVARDPASPISYQWYGGGEAIEDATGPDYTVPTGLEDGRYYYYCSITCEEYTIVTDEILVVVAPEPFCLDTLPEPTAVYGQTLADVEIENPAGNSPGTWAWVDPTASVGDAGVRSFAAVFHPVRSDIYEDVETQLSVTVEKSTPVLAFKDDEQYVLDKVYDGRSVTTPDNSYVSVEGSTDVDVSFRWYQGETQLMTPPVHAGAYRLVAYLWETDNAGEATAEKTVVITPKTVDRYMLSLSADRATYTGSEICPVVTIWDGNSLISTSEYSVSYQDNIAAGTATVTISDGDEHGNYILGEMTTSFRIQPKELNVYSATAEGKIYDGKPGVKVLRVFLTGAVGGDDVSVDVTGLSGDVRMENGHADVGEYTAIGLPDLTLQGEDAENYVLNQTGGAYIPLTQKVQITKRRLQDAQEALDQLETQRFISNKYPYTYQWDLAEFEPALTGSMRAEVPVFTWEWIPDEGVDLAEKFYHGATTGTMGEKNDKTIWVEQEKLFLPLTWSEQPALTPGAHPMSSIRITMQFKNYENITHTIKVLADTRITALIIDWKKHAGEYAYTGDPVQGYDFSDGKNAIGIQPVDESAPLLPVTIKVVYTGINSTYYPTSEKQPKNAGDYRVTASIDPNNENYIGIDSLDFTIAKADPTLLEAPQALDLEYTGADQTLLAPGKVGGGKLNYSLIGNGYFSDSIPTERSAGTYRVYYKLVGDPNHNDLSDESMYVDVTIARKEASITNQPQAILGLSFSGNMQKLIHGGRANGGTMEYSLDGETYSSELPQARNAGEYTVYYRVKGDENHKDLPPQEMTVNIQPTQLQISAVTLANKSYDGTATAKIASVEFHGIASGSWVRVDSSNAVAQLTLAEGEKPVVGEYWYASLSNLKLTGQEAGNYTIAETFPNTRLAAPCRITKAATTKVESAREVHNYSPRTYCWSLEDLIPVEIPAELRAENPASYTLVRVGVDSAYYTEGAEIIDGELYLPINEVDLEDVRVIGYITINLAFDNYNSVDCVLGVATASKPLTDITGVSSVGSVPYTGSGIRGFDGVPSSDHVGDYNISYVGVGGTEYPMTDEQPVEVGTYRVTIRVPSSDLEYSGSVTLNFSIVRATPVVTGIDDGASVYFTGEPVELFPDAKTTGGTLLYALEAEDAEEGTPLVYQESIPTAIDVGEYTVWYMVRENESYVGLEPVRVTVSIRPRQISQGTVSSENEATNVDLRAKVQNGAASATVDTAMSQKIVRQTEESGSTSVQIVPVMEDPDSVTQVTVSVPASAMKELSSGTDVPVTVETPIADVTISAEGIDALADAQAKIDITVKKEAEGVGVTIARNGVQTEQIPGGVVVSIPCDETAAGTVAILVAEDGSQSLVRSSVVENGVLTVKMNGSAEIRWIDNSKDFDDVSEKHWANDAVAFVSSHELMTGVSETRFCPEGTMTRGMLTQVLYNLENEPIVPRMNSFSDVAPDDWYAGAIAWAAANGVVNGYGNGTFGPERSVTREQIAVILYRYLGSPEAGELELTFADTDEIDGYAVDAMRWAVRVGLFTGRGHNILAPKDTATRAEVAILLQRLCEYKAGML